VLVRELLALMQPGVSLPRVTPYREYLAWLSRQDREAAVAAWRTALTDLEEPTRLSAATTTSATPALAETIAVDVPETLTRALVKVARAGSVTLNTVMQAAWGMLLGRYTGRDDVAFGMTVSGRPAEIAGVESMVGLFINTLPVRVKVNARDRIQDVFARVQEEQMRLMPHQHLGLAEIQRAWGQGELFDTLLVFESYPVDEAALEKTGAGVRIGSAEGRDVTHYPLSVWP
jgi:hypothetical protein